MEFSNKAKLINALLGCQAISDPQNRDTIIDDLPPNIKDKIKRAKRDRFDVRNIITACANYPNGLNAFIEIVRYYEGNSIPFKQVETVLQEIQTTFTHEPSPQQPDESLEPSYEFSQINRTTWPSWKPTRFWPQSLSAKSGISDLLRYSPFENDYAENELDFLFGEAGGFWGHPLYPQLTHNTPSIIYGGPGCGRTTLAHALVEIDRPVGRHHPKVLPIYSSTQTQIINFQRSTSLAILTYICASPFVLTLLATNGLNLLARQLHLSLSLDIIMSYIENAKRQQPYGAGPEAQRESWKKNDLQQLRRFKNALKNNELTAAVSLQEWLSLTERIVEALKFDYILINLDLNRVPITALEAIFTSLRTWQEHRLVINLFLPERLVRKLDVPEDLNLLILDWREKDFQALTKWRFGCSARLAQARYVPEQFFEGDLYTEFIEAAQKNPRRLARLWKLMFQKHLKSNPEKTTFSGADLEWAVEQLNGT